MEVATIEIPYRSRRAMFRFHFIGDIHLGSCLCDEAELEKTLAEIHGDPSARVFLMGDLGEWIPKGEWRWREENIAEWVDRTDVAASQEQYIIKLFKPLARQHKILGAIQGNHEMELCDTWNQNVHKHICEALNIRNLGYLAFVRLQFTWKRGDAIQSHVLKLFLHHGFGGGRSDGADVNRFGEYQRDYDCDWFIAGHTHRRFAIKSIQHGIGNNGLLSSRVRLAGRSGTFLRTIMQGRFGYPEKTALRPLETGSLMVTFSPDSMDSIANI